MRFWDSSALIPLVVRERHSTAPEPLIEDDPDMVVWWAGGVECTSAVHRLRREGTRAADALQLAAALTWARHAPEGRDLVSLDAHLREAALLEGFRVLPQA